MEEKYFARPKNREESEQIQREWFAMGSYWSSGNKECPKPQFTDMPLIFTDNGGSMSYANKPGYVPNKGYKLYKSKRFNIEYCLKQIKELKNLM